MNQVVLERDIVSAIPLPAPGMTRREKLLRWAQIVRQHQGYVQLMHAIEHFSTNQLAMPCFTVGDHTPFGLAMADKVFAEGGLKSSTNHIHLGSASLSDVMGFMEVTQSQLHEFSCDCGGAISNTDMADRIERLA